MFLLLIVLAALRSLEDDYLGVLIFNMTRGMPWLVLIFGCVVQDYDGRQLRVNLAGDKPQTPRSF